MMWKQAIAFGSVPNIEKIFVSNADKNNLIIIDLLIKHKNDDSYCTEAGLVICFKIHTWVTDGYMAYIVLNSQFHRLFTLYRLLKNDERFRIQIRSYNKNMCYISIESLSIQSRFFF